MMLLHAIDIGIDVLKSLWQDRSVLQMQVARPFCLRVYNNYNTSPKEQTVRGRQARLFIATQTQIEANPSAVISQLLFHSCFLYVLIGFRVTNSFIARGIIERIDLEPTSITKINIRMSNGDKVMSSHMLLYETIILRG